MELLTEITFNSASILYQHRGWDWATHGALSDFRAKKIERKSLKSFSKNELQLENWGPTRLDFQITAIFTEAEALEIGKLIS
ncbi:hypothetical protein [Bdellovibrio svalbardensis]|uniref:hypothetical protein n=1 Tax=Bdellovibrio svalbardensis TaxID=2972972 RepID=UPI00240821D0|nr:hypothetical protein [Bdellovibrio svalbardensis]